MSDPGAASAEQASWKRAAAWALVLTRWVAAQIAINRLDGFRTIAWLVTAIALPIAAISLVAEPDWPWLSLAGVVVVLGGAAVVALTLTIVLLRRLSLSRRARPLAKALDAAKDSVLAELAEAGAPVSAGSAFRFVVRLALGKSPHRDVAIGLHDMVRDLDRVLDTEQLQAALRQ